MQTDTTTTPYTMSHDTTTTTAQNANTDAAATQELIDTLVDDTADATGNSGFGVVEFEQLDPDTIRASLRDGHPAPRLLGAVNFENSIPPQFMEFVSDSIYGDENVAMREMLQNSNAACIRRAKRIISDSDQYDDGWLTVRRIVDVESDEVVAGIGEPLTRDDVDEADLDTIEKGGAAEKNSPSGLRRVLYPRPVREVLNAAQSLGYEPVIEVEFDWDSRTITITDNGDGMDVHTVTSEYNDAFESMSGEDVETGGQFGVGAKSHVLITGEDGLTVVSSRPMGDDSHGGYKIQATMQGVSFLPGKPEFDHPGTAVEMKMHENITDRTCRKVQDWVEKFTQGLPVAVKYDETKQGNSRAGEEYLPTTFDSDRFDAPLTIEGGAFTLLAGPNVAPRTSYGEPDNAKTFLAGLPIDSTRSHDITTLYDIVVFLHDEQGRIIAGPNRGRYEDNIDGLEEGDVALPEPKGSRDALKTQSTGYPKPAFKHFAKLVKQEEMDLLTEMVRSIEQDGPVGTFEDSADEWDVFRRMIKRHAPRRATKSGKRMKKFISGEEYLPDVSDGVAEQIADLFNKVQYMPDRKKGKYKSKRSEKRIGWVLAQSRPVYMAASTSGHFDKYCKVAVHNHDSPTFIKISGSTKYDSYQQRYGFKKLVDLPIRESDDHDLNIPSTVVKAMSHADSRRTSTDNIENKVCLRTTEGSGVDQRVPFAKLLETVENDDLNDDLIVYYSDGPNISDKYHMGKYATICHVSKKSMAHDLLSNDGAFTHEEFRARARQTEFETTVGTLQAQELVDRDEVVILFHCKNKRDVDESVVADPDNELCKLLCRDALSNHYSKSEDDDYIAVFADNDSMRQSRPFFRVQRDVGHIIGVKFSGHRKPTLQKFTWKTPRTNVSTLRQKVETPNWDNDSDVYRSLRRANEPKEGLYLFCHDIGIDPTKYDSSELRDLTEIDDAADELADRV